MAHRARGGALCAEAASPPYCAQAAPAPPGTPRPGHRHGCATAARTTERRPPPSRATTQPSPT
eukprot:3968432-Lingulodinium_polyedra.AAC.1